MTAVLGYLAINVPAGTGFGNLPFVAIMVGAHGRGGRSPTSPTRSRGRSTRSRFAVGAPIVLGGIAMLALIATGKATPRGDRRRERPRLVRHDADGGGRGAPSSLGPIAWAAFAMAGRLGFGPLAPAPSADEPSALLPPPSPPPSAAWLRPGAQLGLPVVWMVDLACWPCRSRSTSRRTCPWAFIENHRLIGNWPDGHTGQSLLDLTGAMYAYHNGLTAPHAASSPWWAWLFDLKPVWFYQEGLAGNTTSAIYDAGNLVIWWLGAAGDGVRGVAGVQAAEPRPRPRHDRVRLPVGGLGADRPGVVPVPLLHEPAVPVPRPRLLPRGALARRVAADLADGAPDRRRRRSSARRSSGSSTGRSAASST